MLGNALVFDPEALATPPKKPLRLPGVSDKDLDITRTEKPDGSSTIVVKQPLQTDWSNSVGADLGPTSGRSAFDHPLLTTRDSSPSGAAWASMGVSNFGSVDARVDPFNEQGKVGTTLKQSIPFGGRFAVTLQNTYSVTETLGQPTAGPTDMPLMALPPSAAPGSSQVFGNERSVKFKHPSDRDNARRGPNERQQRSDHAQYVQRRAEALWPPPGYHRGDRFRPNYQQQEHQCRI
jgi:hypothetical protein